jgi:hypothetical protein
LLFESAHLDGDIAAISLSEIAPEFEGKVVNFDFRVERDRVVAASVVTVLANFLDLSR